MQRRTPNPAANPEINFDDLPPEMKLSIFENLDLPDLHNVSKVSSHWCNFYNAVGSKKLADKALYFLRQPNCIEYLTREMLHNISNIISCSPRYRRQFYYALRTVRDRLLVSSRNTEMKENLRNKVSYDDVQDCMIRSFGFASFLNDNLLALFVMNPPKLDLYAGYFAPFVLLREKLRQGRGQFELKLCNEIYANLIVEKIYYANDELYFTLRFLPDQPHALGQFIDRIMQGVANDQQLLQVKAEINRIAAAIRFSEQSELPAKIALST